MANAYFFSNETKNECVYVKNTGTYLLEVESLVVRICQSKKWDSNDKVIIMFMNSQNLITYLYQNNKFEILRNKDTKYDCIEIESNEVEIEEDHDDDYYEDYDDYDDYDIDAHDDRYDERDDDDYGSGGYEDECYECCDMY